MVCGYSIKYLWKQDFLLPELNGQHIEKNITCKPVLAENYDSGLRVKMIEILRAKKAMTDYKKCLVVFDMYGSGWNRSLDDLYKKMHTDLRKNGWKEDKIEIIIISPELEQWIWKDYSKIANLAGKNKKYLTSKPIAVVATLVA